MDKNNPAVSHALDPQLHLRPSGKVDKISLIQFDLSSIPPGTNISSVALFLNDESGKQFPVEIYRVTQPWVDSTITWDNMPTYDSTSLGNLMLAGTPCVVGAYISPALVQDWVDHPTTNFGVVLFPPSGTGDAAISSKEGILPPKLVVVINSPEAQLEMVKNLSTLRKQDAKQVLKTQTEAFELFVNNLRKNIFRWLP